MDERLGRPRGHVAIVRAALALFVLAWIFGPYELRSTVPVWLVFLLALGLEVQFFVGATRTSWRRDPDRGPQAVDRELYGYPEELADPFLEEEQEGEDEPDDELEEPVAALPAGRRLQGPLARLLTGVALIGALAIVLRVVDAHTGWRALSSQTRAAATARFSQEASAIAGKPVTIRCDESGRYVGAVQHADGIAGVGGNLAYLTPQRCLDLYRLAFRHQVRGSQTGRALAVLAHESWHLRGVRDEATTECYALQSGVQLAGRLGLSEGVARGLMRQQLTENALHASDSPEYLVTAGCRDGGALDLHPASTRWP